MSSSLIQRKVQTKPDESEGEAKDGTSAEPSENPAVREAPAKSPSAVRQRLQWFINHPEICFTLATTVTCILLLLSFSRPRKGPVLFNKNQLTLYNGKKNAPFYLAILGEVYDVTKGRKHYNDEKGYGGFIGRDSSRAFVTGDFTGDLTDDILDFSPEQFRSLVEWRDFYRKHKQYTFKGRLVGRFYNAAGKPTRLLRLVEEEASKAKSEEELQREMEAQWPSCNVRWTEAEGVSVWCDPPAYPRKIIMDAPGGKPSTRCACFEEIGWSDVRQVYPDCEPDAHLCKV